MRIQHEGGCLCGSVRYYFEGDPLVVAICHCRHCQRQSGAPFSVVMGVAEAMLHRQGETRTYRDTGDSGEGVDRVFCPACGSPILSRINAMPGVTFLKAGTLDEPGHWTPTMEVYCARAWPWMPKFADERHSLSNIGSVT